MFIIKKTQLIINTLHEENNQIKIKFYLEILRETSANGVSFYSYKGVELNWQQIK